VNAWNSAALDVLDYQWSVAAPFWSGIDTLAGDHGVKVALELHPQNLVFNTADVLTLVVRRLGRLVYQTAAKDVRINPEHARLYGVLDNSFRRLGPRRTGSTSAATNGPTSGPSSPPGTSSPSARATTSRFWTEFLRALHEVDPDMLVNIEHEDTELGRIEGLQVAARVLLQADRNLVDSPSPASR
jgi:sugar phosphate isomerase/epimerase